mgnify:CR=1 FL=1
MSLTTDPNDPRLTWSVDIQRVQQKVCTKCGKTKCLGDFSHCTSHGRPRVNSWCKRCNSDHTRLRYRQLSPEAKKDMVERNEQRRREQMVFLLNYLAKHGCADCREDDPVVLEFDHVTGKKANISAIVGSWSYKRLKTEISKCEIRCANCHARKTAQQLGYYKYASFGPNFWPGGK